MADVDGVSVPGEDGDEEGYSNQCDRDGVSVFAGLLMQLMMMIKMVMMKMVMMKMVMMKMVMMKIVLAMACLRAFM